MTATSKEIRVGQFINTPAGLALMGSVFIVLIMAITVIVVVASMFFRVGDFTLFAIFIVLLAVFVYLAGTLVGGVVWVLRNKDKAILVFERDGFLYFSKDFSRHQYVAYKDIVKVYKPNDKKYKVDEICIRKMDGVELIIVANGLVLDSRGIFSILVERCPDLWRPYSTVMLLKKY